MDISADAVRSRTPRPPDQRQRQSRAQAPAAPDSGSSSLLGMPLIWFWYRELTGSPLRPGIPAIIRDSPELAILGLMLVMITAMMMIPLLASGKSPHTMLRPSDSDHPPRRCRRCRCDPPRGHRHVEPLPQPRDVRRGDGRLAAPRCAVRRGPGYRQDLSGQGDRRRGRGSVPVRVGQRVPVPLLRDDQPQDPPVLQGAPPGGSCRGRRDRVHRGVRRHRHGSLRHGPAVACARVRRASSTNCSCRCRASICRPAGTSSRAR